MEQPIRDKKCPKCNGWRFKTQFIKDSREMKTCEVCRNYGKKYIDKIKDKRKQHYIDNADKIKEQTQQYRIDNADKIKEQKKQHYNDNRDKISEKNKQFHIDNPNYRKEYREEQQKNNPLHTKFNSMIRSSKTKDKKYNLTITEDYITMDYLNELWIKQNGFCFYQDCECVLDYESFDYHKRNDNLITIQRHDNNICHSQSNVCFACFNCNVIKRKELEQFTQLLQASESLTLQ